MDGVDFSERCCNNLFIGISVWLVFYAFFDSILFWVSEIKDSKALNIASDVSYLIYSGNQGWYLSLLIIALVRIRRLFKASANVAINEKIVCYHIVFVTISCSMTLMYAILIFVHRDSSGYPIIYGVVNFFMLISLIMMLYIY